MHISPLRPEGGRGVAGKRGVRGGPDMSLSGQIWTSEARGLGGGGERTEFPVFYRTLSPSGPLPKRGGGGEGKKREVVEDEDVTKTAMY